MRLFLRLFLSSDDKSDRTKTGNGRQIRSKVAHGISTTQINKNILEVTENAIGRLRKDADYFLWQCFDKFGRQTRNIKTISVCHLRYT